MAEERRDAPEPIRAQTPAPCSLSDSGLASRLEWLRREILPHVTGSESLAEGVAFDLDSGAELRAKLERLVALEAECCPGLELRVRVRPDGGHRLEATGAGATRLRGLASGDATA